MDTLFDPYGNLNIDELIAEQPSFQKIMADKTVTPEEIQVQADHVAALLHDFEKTASPDQIELMRKILAELSVLVAVNDYIKSSQTTSERK